MREATEREVLLLPDCAPGCLEAVLRFCYCGECRVPKQDMLPLLVLADRLDIPALVAVCEKVGCMAVNEISNRDYNSSVEGSGRMWLSEPTQAQGCASGSGRQFWSA